ncbi:MAG TPA: hypothetical protein VKT28_08040, partial [Puia sp.]|nr:hypothetical protein [Puia sp.]
TIMIFVFPVLAIILLVIFFGWFYMLGTKLAEKLPETVTVNLTKFKIFLFSPIAYIILLSIFMVSMFANLAITKEQPNPLIFLAILPLHLFFMFCIFYCMYFIAKCLRAVELQRPVTFSEFAGEFVLIWFFMIGVWIIQPRINKIFSEEKEAMEQLFT